MRLFSLILLLSGSGEDWDLFGWAVGHVDYNGDGLSDILIGAYGDDVMNDNTGAVFLYEGGYAWTDHDEDGVLDGDDLCLGDDAFGDSDADGNCDIELSITDRQVGSFIKLGAVGAPPGASVLFVASADLGSDCHGSLDVCTGLDGPRVVGRSTVGLDHTAELRLDTSALVGVWHVQAVWVLDGQAEASNVLVDLCLGDADGDGVEDCLDTCVGQDLAGDIDGDGRCEPVLTLPAIMSGDVTLSLFGAPVGADVSFYSSDTLGSDCSLGIDTCLDLDAPELVGTAIADGAGAAEIDYLVEVAGTMHFQATWSFGPDAEASAVGTRSLAP